MLRQGSVTGHIGELSPLVAIVNVLIDQSHPLLDRLVDDLLQFELQHLLRKLFDHVFLDVLQESVLRSYEAHEATHK